MPEGHRTKPPALDYRGGEPRRHRRNLVLAGAGFLLSVGTSFATAFFVVVLAFDGGEHGLTLIALAVAVTLFSSGMLVYHRTWSRSFLAGALAGFGVALLAAGLCAVEMT